VPIVHNIGRDQYATSRCPSAACGGRRHKPACPPPSSAISNSRWCIQDSSHSLIVVCFHVFHWASPPPPFLDVTDQHQCDPPALQISVLSTRPPPVVLFKTGTDIDLHFRFSLLGNYSPGVTSSCHHKQVRRRHVFGAAGVFRPSPFINGIVHCFLFSPPAPFPFRDTSQAHKHGTFFSFLLRDLPSYFFFDPEEFLRRRVLPFSSPPLCTCVGDFARSPSLSIRPLRSDGDLCPSERSGNFHLALHPPSSLYLDYFLCTFASVCSLCCSAIFSFDQSPSVTPPPFFQKMQSRLGSS